MRNGEWKGSTEEQDFEQALRRGLRRVDAPEDLLARVIAQVEEAASRKQEAGSRGQEAASRGSWFSLDWLAPRWGWKPAWGALAALLVAALLTGHVVREHRLERRERARVQASREFDVSVEITDQALHHAREQLRKAGVALDEDGQ